MAKITVDLPDDLSEVLSARVKANCSTLRAVVIGLLRNALAAEALELAKDPQKFRAV